VLPVDLKSFMLEKSLDTLSAATDLADRYVQIHLTDNQKQTQGFKQRWQNHDHGYRNSGSFRSKTHAR
jgi:hypothetical protein